MVKFGVAVLSLSGWRDSSAELVGHGLHSVADAQNGQAGVVHPIRGERRAGFIDAGRPAGKHDALRIEGPYGLPGGGVRYQFAIDAALPDAPGD